MRGWVDFCLLTTFFCRISGTLCYTYEESPLDGDIYCLSDSIVDDMKFFCFITLDAEGSGFYHCFISKDCFDDIAVFLFLNGWLSRKLLTPAVDFCFMQTQFGSKYTVSSPPVLFFTCY